MNSQRRALLMLVFAALLAIVMGCADNNTGTGKSAAESAEQSFKDQQRSTVTPNGKIRTDTAKGKDGKIEYETEDGKKWKVGYSKRPDGTYEYQTPAERK